MHGTIVESAVEQEAIPPANNASTGFTSTCDQLLVGDQKIILRILKMEGSTMLFIGKSMSEFMDELAVAMLDGNPSNEALSSTLLGEHVMTDSQRLARQLTKRFKRQFFVSCNIPMNDMNGRLLERELSNYMRKHETELA